MELLQAAQGTELLQRMVTVASPVRPMQAETMASLCKGLALSRRSDGNRILQKRGGYRLLYVVLYGFTRLSKV